jgi:hypothetical protein
MNKSLKDIIREEFEEKISTKEYSLLINETDLDKNVIIKSLEALLPDKDWKENKDDEQRLIKKNALKLINNLTSNTGDED